MPLESLESDKQPNIKGLSIESPKKKRQDPFIEIDQHIQDNWEVVEDILAPLDHPDDIVTYSEILQEALLAYPEGRSKVKIGTLVDNSIEHRLKNSTDFETYFDTVLQSKVLQPQKYEDYDYNPKPFEELIEYINKVGKFDTRMLFTSAFGASLAFPEKMKEVECSQERWKQLREQAKEFISQGKYYELVTHLCFVKLMYSDKLKLKLNDNLWQKFFEQIKNQEKTEWMSLLNYIVKLKILKAEKIKLTNQGVEFIMPREKEEGEPEVTKPPIKKEY